MKAGRLASIVDSLTVNILQHSILHAVNKGELHKGCLSYLGSLEKTSIFKPHIRIKQMAWASAAREKAGDESRPVSLNKESVTLLSPGLRVKPCTVPCFFSCWLWPKISQGISLILIF